MRVLILGSGAKSHALASFVAQSRRITELFVAPGNGGTDLVAKNLPHLDISDKQAVLRACKDHNIDFVVIGNDKAIVNGTSDLLLQEGFNIFGATENSIALENDKDFFISFTKRQGIPTPQIVIIKTEQGLIDYANNFQEETPLILKPARIAPSRLDQEVHTKEDLLQRGTQLLEQGAISIESKIFGAPIAVTAIMDMKGYKLLPFCGNYSRSHSEGRGDITSGMGAVAPVPVENRELLSRIHSEIIEPTFRGVFEENLQYRGALVFSIILTPQGPVLLDYHIKLNDPSTQAIAPLIQSDAVDIAEAVVQDRISEFNLHISEKICVAVVVASKGYPRELDTNKIVEAFYPYPYKNSRLYFGAVRFSGNGQLITNGGRCFTSTGIGDNLEQANQNAYERLRCIHFEGSWYREDIGNEFLKL